MQQLLLIQDLSRLELWDKHGFIFVSILQKLTAPVYYLVLLRTVVSLGHDRWYLRDTWVQQFSTHA